MELSLEGVASLTPNSRWRNRSEFINGRTEIVAFFTRKWAKELDYRLIKELWDFTESRIAVRYAHEWHDDSGSWFRSFGNENWEYHAAGLMQRRFACINDLPIKEADRKFNGLWDGAHAARLRSGCSPKPSRLAEQLLELMGAGKEHASVPDEGLIVPNWPPPAKHALTVVSDSS
jgi:nuclear transport factor 2 (NTF2) superfamily protein